MKLYLFIGIDAIGREVKVYFLTGLNKIGLVILYLIGLKTSGLVILYLIGENGTLID